MESSAVASAASPIDVASPSGDDATAGGNKRATLKPHKRIVELDALRAFAAINLVMFHFTHVYDVKFGYVQPLGWQWPFGAYGTAMFFILSGFVNSMSLMRRRQPADFVAARLIRIVPMFLIVIVANLAVMTLPPLNESTVSTGQFFANLTLIPRVFGYECIDPVMWTLQVEMLFYLLLVAMFTSGALRNHVRCWGILLVASLVVCPLLDGLKTGHEGAGWFAAASAIRHLLLLDFVPLFAIGFTLYQIKTGVGAMWKNIALIAAAMFVFHSIDHGKHNPVATLLIIGMVTMAAYGKIPVLRLKPFVFVSTISYALYLCHNNLGCALIYRLNHGGYPSQVALGVTLLFAFAVGTLVTTRMEQPMTRRLREAWTRYRAPQRVGGGGAELAA
ncbi:acyltransferase family protein [Crateriforma conspicua]|uniref:O-acetyltransferase OatA n=1 Tax=Crateriforma conspicua TaxID=2527996 RepID=A0A5C5Y123_9PLAN|nr:acyltransferase [Crateriforma conspicua]TWT67985.1 O-acetyltransferase OatA [Crateriforma conspicua]